MPIPSLNEFGLLPPGAYRCTLADVEHVFCTNQHRQKIWTGLLAVLEMLRSMDLAYPIFIAGGFTTDKTLPEDVDLVHDLRFAHAYNQFRGYQLFTQQRSAIKNEHAVDYCVNLAGETDFSAFFQYAGPKTALLTGIHERDRRGILRIESRTWLDGLNR